MREATALFIERSGRRLASARGFGHSGMGSFEEAVVYTHLATKPLNSRIYNSMERYTLELLLKGHL